MNHSPIHYYSKISELDKTSINHHLVGEHFDDTKKQFIISIENSSRGFDELERMIHDFENILRVMDLIDRSQTVGPIYRASFSKMAKRLKHRLGPILDGLKQI
jgi:hypothetical protein